MYRKLVFWQLICKIIYVTFANFTYLSSEAVVRMCSAKKMLFKYFAKSTKEHLCQSLFFNIKLLRPATLLKKRLWHRYFPVNLAKFLRAPFLQNTSVRLLLVIILANVFVSRLLLKQSRYLDILFLLALCEQQSNHFFFLVLISMNRDSVLSCNLHSVSKQEEGSSLTYRSISSALAQGSRL